MASNEVKAENSNASGSDSTPTDTNITLPPSFVGQNRVR